MMIHCRSEAREGTNALVEAPFVKEIGRVRFYLEEFSTEWQQRLSGRAFFQVFPSVSLFPFPVVTERLLYGTRPQTGVWRRTQTYVCPSSKVVSEFLRCYPQGFTMFWCVTLCGALLFAAQPVTAVNVDVDNALVHSGTDQSMFGFSVAMHISNGRPM